MDNIQIRLLSPAEASIEYIAMEIDQVSDVNESLFYIGRGIGTRLAPVLSVTLDFPTPDTAYMIPFERHSYRMAVVSLSLTYFLWHV